ncbi:protein of unknown function [Ralstonia solanacearum CMR15]|nr:protein of unknown function [Ralstonia solanacearum CMR15]
MPFCSSQHNPVSGDQATPPPAQASSPGYKDEAAAASQSLEDQGRELTAAVAFFRTAPHGALA